MPRPLLLLLSCFVYCTTYLGASSYIMTPPKGWSEITDPSQLPQKIRVIYIGKGSSTFTPSINVATESTSLSLSDYVSLATSYHLQQIGTKCSSLGRIQTAAGIAQMIQIDRSSQWGDIRFVQAMLIRRGIAHVVTATCLKNEFSLHSIAILRAIQSLQITEKSLSTK